MLYGKEDGRVSGRINSKVSKIATMFQPSDEPSFSFEESKTRDVSSREADIPKNLSVVRTESHVARFINAKAMFEKMSENNRKEGKINDIPGKINDVFQRNADVPGKINDAFQRNADVPGKTTSAAGRTIITRISSLSPTGVRTRNSNCHSRSPSPVAINNRKSNGHATKLPSVATISSTAISPPLSPAPSLISPSSSSPVPRSLTSSCRTLSASSSDSGDFPRKKDEHSESKVISRDSNILMVHDKNTSRRIQKVTPLPNNTDSSTNITHCVEENKIPTQTNQHTFKTKCQPSKPNKPTKPTALKNVGVISSHEHHQELMKRQINWFQSYSRAKSPSSPVKSDSDRALSPDNSSMSRISNLLNEDTKFNKCFNSSFHRTGAEELSKHKEHKSSETEKCELVKSFFSGGQSDTVKERAALFSGRHNKKSTQGPVEVKSEQFETSSTLPSKWCPPKLYAEYHSKPVTKSGKSSSPVNKIRESLSSSSHQSEYISMPAQLYTNTTNEVQVPPIRSSSVDELERVEENGPIIRRLREQRENIFKRMVTSEPSIFRHSFHREPDHNIEREIQQTRRFSSLEGDREKRLKEWERKKTEREKRHSEGNLSNYFMNENLAKYERTTNCTATGNILDRIMRYENSIYSNNRNQYHSSIELSTRINFRSLDDNLLATRLKQDSSRNEVGELEEKTMEPKGINSDYVEEHTQNEMERKRKERTVICREKEDYEHNHRQNENVELRQKEQENVDVNKREQEIKHKSREGEKIDCKIKEQEEIEKRKKDQEIDRLLKEEKELEYRRNEKKDIERRRKEKEDQECKRLELIEIERKNYLIEAERKRKELEEMERIRIEKEEIERIRKEQEEKERNRVKEEEINRRRNENEELLRKFQEQEEKEHKQKEQEDIERKRIEKEKLDNMLIHQEELERLRLEQKKIEQIRREQEEKERLRIEQEEMENIRREEEEIERIHREKEEIDRIRREQEEIDRVNREQEEIDCMRRAQEEMDRMLREREEMECMHREQEEIKRVRREQEEMESISREHEEIERRRIEREEMDRTRREQEEMDRICMEREEMGRMHREQEENQRLHTEQKKIKRVRKEQEENERIHKEQEEIKQITREQNRTVIEEISSEEEGNNRIEQDELIHRQSDREKMVREQTQDEEIQLGRNLQVEIPYIREQKEKEHKRMKKEEILREPKEKIEFERNDREKNDTENIFNKTDELKIETYQKEQYRDNKTTENTTKQIVKIRSEIEDIRVIDRKVPPDMRSSSCEDEIERRRMQRKNEELFRQLEEEKKQERRKYIQDEIHRKKQQIQKLNSASTSSQYQPLDSSESSSIILSCSQSDEEDRKRIKKDQQEIMKTKQRIAELKREREEIRKQQVAQMQRLLNSPDVNQMNEVPSTEKKTDIIDFANSVNENDSETVNDHKSSENMQGDTYSKEEIFYDHTVLSAQHKIELCGSSIPNDHTKYDSTAGHESPYYKYPASTISSVEPLPPPIPPHNVDPASLLLPLADSAEDTNNTNDLESFQGPEVMTPEEQQKLLSFNDDRSLLSDAQATEACLLLDESNQYSVKTSDEIPIVKGSLLDYNSDQYIHQNEILEMVTHDNSSIASSEKEVKDEDFIERVKEVMEVDGVHYYEDGHFWMEIPGISTDDDEIFDPSICFHKHSRISFSNDPIRLYSTHSVTDYDRKNDDVDPVAASAEYELEKRVEKMDVFPVQVQKSECGLGLSIIGMGVGADAGVEKLGIFVKTITAGGATEADGRIAVNDQIIEVDGKSLVGVTQSFAASVLKNTSGLVRFLIGREKDPDSSEVAVLIRQSLQADREREERRRALEGPNFDPNNSGVFFDSLSSASDDPSPIDPTRSRFEHYDDLNEGRLIDKDIGDETISSVLDGYGHHNVDGNSLASSEIMLLRHHLQEAQQTNEMYEEELNILRSKLNELERDVSDRDGMSARFNDATKKLQDAEETLQARLAEISTYQDMLEQSQGQHLILEKKYLKAKKVIKEYQNRERDFLHREDYYITQLDEKDTHYNSLVKALKDRVIQLEGGLMNAQKSSGLPIQVTPVGNSALNLTGHTRHSNKLTEPPKLPQSLICLDADISDTETGEGANSEESRSSTVERKAPTNEDLDSVVSHSLLDVSASKAKGELASRGGLAKRHLPSLKKSGSRSSTGSFDRGPDDSLEDCFGRVTSSPSVIYEQSTSESSTTSTSSFTQSSSSHYHQEIFQSSSYYTALSSTGHSHSSHPATSTPRAPPPYHPPPSAPLTQRPLSQGEWGVPGSFSYERSDVPYRHAPPIARVQPVNRVDAVESVAVVTESLPVEAITEHPQRLADQLKAVLTEREASSDVTSFNPANPIKKSLSNLMEDVRKAVSQADVSLGKKPMISAPTELSGISSEIISKSTNAHRLSANSLQQRLHRDSWTPQCQSAAPKLSNQGISDPGVILLSQKPIDSSLSPIKNIDVREENISLSSLDSFNRSAIDTSGQVAPVCDWSKEQVAQWLMIHGLETCVSKFLNSEITGPRLINLDTKDVRNLGLSNDEKNKLKKKVRDLRVNIEKERKQAEKEKKEKEKLLKKAEKLAEKAERRKK